MSYQRGYGVIESLGLGKHLASVLVAKLDFERKFSFAGAGWNYDPEMREMRNVRKGYKVDRIAAEKREHTTELMEAMPQMLAEYRKRRWERKMKAEKDSAKKALHE